MEITNIDLFIDYVHSIRKRTIRVIKKIPEEKINWKPVENAFSFADIIRHISAINYHMYGQNAQFKQSSYPGHMASDQNVAAKSYDEVMEFFNIKQEQTINVIENLTLEDLRRKVETPAGVKITLWKWLRTMVEHEIHHRGQIYTYLKLLETKSPPLYGLTSEEVKHNSR